MFVLQRGNFARCLKIPQMTARQQLLVEDNDAITIDSALDGDAEEGVVPDFAVVGAAGRADGTAAGEGQNESGGGGEQSEFLHDFLLLVIGCAHAGLTCTTKQITPISS